MLFLASVHRKIPLDLIIQILCQGSINYLKHNLKPAVFGEEGRKEMFYLTTYLIHFIYGYMASGVWCDTANQLDVSRDINV